MLMILILKKFPFDKQTLLIELWSEYPSFLVEMSPNEPYMTDYAETGIFEKDGKPLSVDGLECKKSDI